MSNCRAVQEELTAWCDGELSDRQAQGIEQHLHACPACAAEAEGIRAAVHWQREALAQVVTAPDLNLAMLHGNLRRSLAADPEPQRASWTWLFRPFALAGAAVMIAAMVLFSLLGGPKAVLIPLGVEPPPVEVSSEPELFENYQLIQHLDALENFDTVESVPLDDDALQKG